MLVTVEATTGTTIVDETSENWTSIMLFVSTVFIVLYYAVADDGTGPTHDCSSSLASVEAYHHYPACH